MTLRRVPLHPRVRIVTTHGFYKPYKKVVPLRTPAVAIAYLDAVQLPDTKRRSSASQETWNSPLIRQ
jgi:hypothetical protein